MAKRCVPCMSAEAKSILLGAVRDPNLTTVIENVPECRDGVFLDLCERQKRRRSAYNKFMSQCMIESEAHGEEPPTERMTRCAELWSRQEHAGR